MRVACTQSLRGSGSLAAELNAPLCLNEIIELLVSYMPLVKTTWGWVQ